MVTGFDILTHDRRLRRHWLKRAGAFVADAIMVFIPVTVILWLLDITEIFEIGLVTSLAFYGSSAVMEAAAGATAGKLILGMRVRSLRGERVGARAFLRNLSRLLWFVLPPIDFALGMATRGDPRQKLLDRAAGTTVVIESERKWHESFLAGAEASAHTRGSEGKAEEDKPDTAVEDTDEGGDVGEPPGPTSASEDKCHQCGGHLILLADEKLQCGKCGLIQ